MGTIIVRVLQLCFIGLLLAGMFMLGVFVFMLTAGVLVILGVVYWLRARGILNSPADAAAHSTYEYSASHHTPQGTEKITVIETEYTEVTSKD